MEQFLQLFRQIMEQVLQETLATNADFLQRLRELQETNDTRLETILRYTENATRGQTQGTALSQNDLNQLNAMITQSAEHIIRDMNTRAATNIAQTLASGDDTHINRLEDNLNLYGNQLVNAAGDWLDRIEHMNNAIAMYNQAIDADEARFEQLSPFEKLAWNMQRWGVAFEQNRRDFLQDVRNYQNQYGVNQNVATAAIQGQYRTRGIPTAEFLNPAGQPGGSAAMATERQKFIKQLVAGITNSALGKKIMNVAAEGASMAALAMASTAPPWLQKTILMAIYLGVPQAIMSGVATLPSAILNLMSTRFGRLLLGRGLQAMGSMAPVAGPTAAALLGLLSGGIATNAIGSKMDKAIDTTSMNKASKEGTKAISWGALGAVLGAVLLGVAGVITSPFWAGVAVFASIGAIVVGIFQGIKHLIGWWKEKDNTPGWLSSLFAWWGDHMPLRLGGNGKAGKSTGSDNTYIDKNGNEVVKAPLGSNVKGGLTSLYGEQLIDTSKYSKTQLNGMLAKSAAYESIANGGKGWSTSQGSFINDVMFAARGTSQILDSVVAKDSSLAGKLVLTSAYGSATSPHSKRGNKSHYVGGGKLDFSLAGMNDKQRKEIQQKLLASGYFEFADIEKQPDGEYHIDAKIKETALKNLSDEAMEQKKTIKSVPQANPFTNKSGTKDLARASMKNVRQ